jgi:hypothetical protein
MKIRGDVHLDKTGNSEFKDEWDFVIDNYTTGANDPEIIDSIGTIAFTSFPQPVRPEEKTEQKIVQPKPIREDPIKTPEKPQPVIITKTETAKTEPVAPITKPVNPPAIEEKFVSRQKSFVKEIPVSGDSIELRFYDNAEIDGDSISLFLNDKLLFSHIRLTGNAWVFKLAVSELKETNELTMVAENMGSIPPNTSYMVAIIGDKRHDAYLASTEGSSAMIRFVKR